jgi:trans-aconitate methyltransferase
MTNWDATEYNQHSSLQAALAREQLSRLTLKGTERILDVGCGDGKITAEIAARVPLGSVLGIDRSPDMIAFANHHFAQPARSNLRYEVADVRRLAYKQEFDRVISFNALHWVREQAAALRSIRAALDSAGQALLRFVPEGHRKSLEDVIEDVRDTARWAGYFTDFTKPYVHFSPEEYRDLAVQEGFRVLESRVEDRAWDFKSREAFLAFGRATFVEWTRCVPESEWLDFITEVLDRYGTVAADKPQKANTFKFYQLEVVLEPA